MEQYVRTLRATEVLSFEICSPFGTQIVPYLTIAGCSKSRYAVWGPLRTFEDLWQSTCSKTMDKKETPILRWMFSAMILKQPALNIREIGRALNVSHVTVLKILHRNGYPQQQKLRLRDAERRIIFCSHVRQKGSEERISWTFASQMRVPSHYMCFITFITPTFGM